MLLGTDAGGVARAQDEARHKLSSRGAVGSVNTWWAFEGFTEVDCCLETDRLLLLIEGKRLETLSPKVEWSPGRNQLWRNVEVAASAAAGREFAVMVVAERHEEPAAALAASCPHLSEDEQRTLAGHYLGCVRWANLSLATGVDYAALPDTVRDVPPERPCAADWIV